MTKEQRTEAKKLVQTFTKEMVRGKPLTVVMENGRKVSAQCSLSRQLDNFKISVGGKVRKIPLVDIEEIIAGEDALQSAAREGLETPLDELSVTFALRGSSCITFRMQSVEERDTLVMCLGMFAN